MADNDDIVTLTMTREQADILQLILWGVYSRGLNHFEGAYDKRRARYHNDKRVRAAAESIEKLTDARRKSIALNFE